MPAAAPGTASEGTTWNTSLFPDKSAALYNLPVKKAVQTTEGVLDGETVALDIERVDVP